MSDLLYEWLNNNRCEMKEKGITEKRYNDIIYDSIIYTKIDHESEKVLDRLLEDLVS
jgi:hypothetical protein